MDAIRRPLTWFAALALGASACAPQPIHIGSPAPEPEPVEAPSAAEEEIGYDPALAGVDPDPVGRELLGDVEYDLPMEVNAWVEAELNWLLAERRAVVGRWMARADRYEPFVRAVLASHGVPTDLHHLAMVESGYVPTARSRAGAVGIWQFMPATGRGMGLRVDDVVDERMDPVRSTHAAARHLRQLHTQFGGDWSLAAAAYNAGGGRIGRGLARFGARDFWELAQIGDLAQETRVYVPRLYAVTIIARNRTRFGYPPAASPERPFAFDSVHLDLETPLDELARIGGVPLHELTELNPHLVQRTVPAGYTAWVPAGRGAEVQHAYRQSEYRRRGGVAAYAVRRGESLASIAEASGVSAARIRELNPGTDPSRLREGARLRLPADAARAMNARPVPRIAVAAGETHRVAAGETLSHIARRYGTTVAALRAANGLSGDGIRAGQTIRLPASSSAAAPAGEHVVQSGDTLWGIARRYSTTVDALRRANELAENAPIQPGQTLVIPARE